MSDLQGNAGLGAAIRPPTEHSRPWTIKWAVIGMWVGAAMAVLGVYVFYLEVDATNRKTFGADYATTDGLVQTGLMISMGFAIGFAVLEVGLWVTMALTNRRGFRWARIVATMLASVGLLYAIFVIFSSVFSETIIFPSVAYNIVNEALAIAVVVMLWHPKSSSYYHAKLVERAIRVVRRDAGTS
ncbi:hypothetical protein ACFWQC_15470 [Nocardioides sp. NPDC058538]|uniref:hypothetical protein n=1 Tax=Nocardioides sp. NPDC058538 TaxID=3346542 RepID=UPI00364FB213